MNLIGTWATDLIDSAGAAAGVAVHLGQDDAVEVERLVERLGAVDGVLAGHGVADEIDLIGPALPIDLPQLVHRHFIDVQPAGGVEDDGIEEVLLGVVEGVAADVDGIGGRRFAVDRHADLLAEHFELIDGGGTLQVGGDQQRLAAALAQRQGELAGRGRFALTLQTAEHEDGRPILGEVEAGIDRPHEGDQLVVDDLEDLLAGIEGAQHFLADGALGDALDEIVGDGVVDVGVEQGLADFLHGLADVGFRDASAAAQLLQGFAEIALNAFKHRLHLSSPGRQEESRSRPGPVRSDKGVNH